MKKKERNEIYDHMNSIAKTAYSIQYLSIHFISNLKEKKIK